MRSQYNEKEIRVKIVYATIVTHYVTTVKHNKTQNKSKFLMSVILAALSSYPFSIWTLILCLKVIEFDAEHLLNSIKYKNLSIQQLFIII